MQKTVLITGASGGIGRAAALAFAREGYRVAAHYCSGRARADALAQLLFDAGCDAQAFCADLSDRAQVERMFAQVQARFGRVDVLVNNAGVARQKLFCDVTPQEWEQIMAVNVTGVFHCCQCALPGMIRRGTGSIVNVSSVWGITGASCEAPYSAAKAAVIGLTKALAKEVGPAGIRVNCVAPGVIDTPMNAQLDAEALDALREETPLGRLGTPEEVADAIVFLAGERASFLTGQILSPNGGFVV